MTTETQSKISACCGVCLGLLLAVFGLGKILRPASLSLMGHVIPRQLSVGVAVLELVLSALLILPKTRRTGIRLAFLFIIFMAVIAILDDSPTCGCVGWFDISRTAKLRLLAIMMVLQFGAMMRDMIGTKPVKHASQTIQSS